MTSIVIFELRNPSPNFYNLATDNTKKSSDNLGLCEFLVDPLILDSNILLRVDAIYN